MRPILQSSNSTSVPWQPNQLASNNNDDSSALRPKNRKAVNRNRSIRERYQSKIGQNHSTADPQRTISTLKSDRSFKVETIHKDSVHIKASRNQKQTAKSTFDHFTNPAFRGKHRQVHSFLKIDLVDKIEKANESTVAHARLKKVKEEAGLPNTVIKPASFRTSDEKH